MSISHLLTDCNVLLVMSLTRVIRAVTSVLTFEYVTLYDFKTKMHYSEFRYCYFFVCYFLEYLLMFLFTLSLIHI